MGGNEARDIKLDDGDTLLLRICCDPRSIRRCWTIISSDLKQVSARNDTSPRPHSSILRVARKAEVRGVLPDVSRVLRSLSLKLLSRRVNGGPRPRHSSRPRTFFRRRRASGGRIQPGSRARVICDDDVITSRDRATTATTTTEAISFQARETFVRRDRTATVPAAATDSRHRQD